jgi:hypothetical protein
MKEIKLEKAEEKISKYLTVIGTKVEEMASSECLAVSSVTES